ncbi:MAG TPA: hypothetical protein VNO70_01100, partial [Blastocatellia bacterium]|nr:hypothetical protein [Blastocatellia bacterium]
MNKMKLVAVLAIAAALVVIGVFNLRDRLAVSPVPYDGIEWVDTENGVQAKSVSPESPLAHTVRKGDYIRYIFRLGKYEEVGSVITVLAYLDELGVGGDARYVIERQDPVLQGIYRVDQPIYDVDFRVASLPKNLALELYLSFIGLVYLAIGLFVLFKQGRAAMTYHFLAWSLASFIVYFYHWTEEFSRLDKLVYVMDNSALALLAPLFLHFCANFPTGRRLSLRSRPSAALLYLPAALLIAGEVLFAYRASLFSNAGLERLRDWLNVIEPAQLLIFFAIGSALLVRTFLRAQQPLLRHQLKWIIWGLGLSLPGVTFYLILYAFDFRITPLIELIAAAPLILIPLSFGYSIVRYRLMDVDIIMRRSFVQVAAIGAVGAIYMAVLLGVGDLVKFIWATADLNSWTTRVVVVAVMLVVALLLEPIRKKFQEWTDRWFYGERYTLRTGLQDFARTLAHTTALPQLQDSLVRRLSDMLSVRKVA